MNKLKIVALLVALLALLIFPLVFSAAAYTSIAIFTLIFAGAAVGWNIFSGFTGYISLGNAVFYGCGAYTMALLCKLWHIPGGYLPFILIVPAGLVGSLVAIPFGWIALRTRRHVFVVITLALLFIMQLLAYNLPGITQGSQGVYLPLAPWMGDAFNLPFYYVAAALLLLAMGVAWWVRHSKYGLSLLAIRDDEDRAQGFGVRTGVHKLTALMISAFFSGTAGALIVYFIGGVFPDTAFSPTFDITVGLMAFFGGVGTLSGPLVGALVLEPLQQIIAQNFGVANLDLIIFGGLLLAVILLLPEGILPSLARLWRTWRATRQVSDQASAAPEAKKALTLEVGSSGEK